MFKNILIVIGFLIFSTLLGCSTINKSTHTYEQKAGEYTLKFILKNPPTSGENSALFILRNASGNIIDNAFMKIEYSTPAMPDRPPMNFHTQAKPTESGYNALLDFPMSGSWEVSVLATLKDKDIKSRFTIDVR